MSDELDAVVLNDDRLCPFVIAKRRYHLRFKDLFPSLCPSKKSRSKMTTAISFSRQNDTGSRVRILSLLKKFAHVLESNAVL